MEALGVETLGVSVLWLCPNTIKRVSMFDREHGPNFKMASFSFDFKSRQRSVVLICLGWKLGEVGVVECPMYHIYYTCTIEFLSRFRRKRRIKTQLLKSTRVSYLAYGMRREERSDVN